MVAVWKRVVVLAVEELVASLAGVLPRMMVVQPVGGHVFDGGSPEAVSVSNWAVAAGCDIVCWGVFVYMFEVVVAHVDLPMLVCVVEVEVEVGVVVRVVLYHTGKNGLMMAVYGALAEVHCTGQVAADNDVVVVVVVIAARGEAGEEMARRLEELDLIQLEKDGYPWVGEAVVLGYVYVVDVWVVD